MPLGIPDDPLDFAALRVDEAGEHADFLRRLINHFVNCGTDWATYRKVQRA